MNSSDFPHPAWTDLLCAIGRVSISWSFLESEMRIEMRKMGRENITKGSVISHWRTCVSELASTAGSSIIVDYLDPIEKVADARNLIVHGIQSLSVDPGRNDGAHVVCVRPDGSLNVFSIDMLHDLARDIDRTKRSIQSLHSHTG